MKTLRQLYELHAGKVSDKWSIYLDEYERLLAPYRNRQINLLEIGIQNGGSIEIWAEYFQDAKKLVGCDINPDCSRLNYTDPRISVIVGDANVDDTERAVSMSATDFDIIIDDGSHTSGDIVKSFSRYFPRLNVGGTFIAEDLHCSYWREFGGGLYDPYSSIGFFKSLADVINHEHWGVRKWPADVLAGFLEEHQCSISRGELSLIHSVEFVNSLCIVRKLPADRNVLGYRFIAGKDEVVVGGHLALRPQTGADITPDQSMNPWSTLERSPAEAWQEQQGQIEQLREQNDALLNRCANQELKSADDAGQIAQLSRSISRGEHTISELRKDIAERDAQLIQLQQYIQAVLRSTSWRLMSPLRVLVVQARGIKNRLVRSRQLSQVPIAPSAPASHDRNDYLEWIRRYDSLDERAQFAMRERVKGMINPPLISVIMPTYNAKHEWLVAAINSVRSQIYQNWELCIADDASTDLGIRPLLERMAREDFRIKLVFREKNGHISAASNSAVELAGGDWVALLDHDDVLPPHALYCVAEAITKNPSARMLYSDEDKIDENGVRHDPYFKCDWNVDLFYSQNMFCHLGVYRRDILESIGGFREGLEGSQDYDLALRCIEQVGAEAIYHIPRVLYHWRSHSGSTAAGVGVKPYAAIAGERALNEHFSRSHMACAAEWVGNGYRVRYALPDKLPLVTVIIPTRNGLHLIRQCIERIIETTTYRNYEIVIVDNGSDEVAVLEYFDSVVSDSRIRVIHDDRPFNYSALNNNAVKHAEGDIIALVNNDVEVISPDWLSEMVSFAIQPSIGVVGAKLFYSNGTLQHGGVILGIGGVAGHANKHSMRPCRGYFERTGLVGSYSAVTAACMLVRKDIFLEIGGLNEKDLSIAFNDVDFCLRVREAGYRNVWTPYAELYHHESVSRGQENNPEKQARFQGEVLYMQQRWGGALLNDPMYSRNLTLDYEDFSLAWPPRVGALA
ncbi:glycosyltransferase [Paraburkholderia sediminicola]|uniref:glycosyltransferase n=1 Tax=Paraburkholderia sediminicola TaxID=458836 RepID=UPI0038BCBC42